MPAGPAQLAIDTGAALKVAHHWFGDGATSQLRCGPAIDTSGGVEATTQLLADAYRATSPPIPPAGCCSRCGRPWSEHRRARIEGPDPAVKIRMICRTR